MKFWPLSKRSTIPDDRYFASLVNVGEDALVTPETAVRFSAVFAAVRVISGGLGALPLVTYKRLKDGGKEKATKHPLYRILKTTPNSRKTTSMEFREMLTGHMLLYGNGYAQIIRNSYGDVLEIYPLHPSRVKPHINQSGNLIYKVNLDNGGEAILPADQMMHLRAFRDSGLEGLSPIAAAAKAIRAGLSMEDFGKNFFEGGGFPSGLLEYPPGGMTQAAKDNLSADWQKKYGGKNRGRQVAVLEGGLKWTPMGIPQSDAQFLEQRRFQIEEISRIYGVPPHLLGDLSRSTNNNIEFQGQEFVTYCLMPWLKRWETVITRDLLDGDDDKYFSEFLLDGLLRGDTTARTASYKTQIECGVLSPNEARIAENRNPYPAGDEFVKPGKAVTQSPEPAQKDPVKDANTDEKPAKTEKKAQIIELKEAFRGAFKETWQRVIRKEIGAMRTAAKKKSGEDFDAWFSEFVPDHMTFAGDCLREVSRAFCGLAGLEAEKVLTTITREYEITIQERAAAWRQDPSSGYVCAEDEVAPYWAERVLNYNES